MIKGTEDPFLFSMSFVLCSSSTVLEYICYFFFRAVGLNGFVLYMCMCVHTCLKGEDGKQNY